MFERHICLDLFDHLTDITWASWCFDPQTTRRFVQKLVHKSPVMRKVFLCHDVVISWRLVHWNRWTHSLSMWYIWCQMSCGIYGIVYWHRQLRCRLTVCIVYWQLNDGWLYIAGTADLIVVSWLTGFIIYLFRMICWIQFHYWAYV